MNKNIIVTLEIIAYLTLILLYDQINGHQMTHDNGPSTIQSKMKVIEPSLHIPLGKDRVPFSIGSTYFPGNVTSESFPALSVDHKTTENITKRITVRGLNKTDALLSTDDDRHTYDSSTKGSQERFPQPTSHDNKDITSIIRQMNNEYFTLGNGHSDLNGQNKNTTHPTNVYQLSNESVHLGSGYTDLPNQQVNTEDRATVHHTKKEQVHLSATALNLPMDQQTSGNPTNVEADVKKPYSYPNDVAGVFADTKADKTAERTMPIVSSLSNFPKYESFNNVNKENKLVPRNTDLQKKYINTENLAGAHSQQLNGNIRHTVQEQPLRHFNMVLPASRQNKVRYINRNDRAYSQDWLRYLMNRSAQSLFYVMRDVTLGTEDDSDK